MTTTIAEQRKLAITAEATALENLKKSMSYTEISPAVKEEMRKVSLAAVLEGVKKRAGADLVNQVLAEAAKN